MPILQPPPPPEDDDWKVGDYIGKPLVLIPIEEDTIDTERAAAVPVLKVDVWVYDPVHGTMDNPGQNLIFWKKVRAQLTAFAGTGEAIAGELVKVSRSYEFHSLPPALHEKVTAAFEKAETQASDAF